MKHAKGDYEPQRIDYFARIIAESNTWVTPTLVTMRNLLAVFDDVDRELARPEARYLHPMGRDIWTWLLENMYLKMPEEHQLGIRRGFEEFQLPLTKALHDRGAKLPAGTDTPLPTLVADFTLHRELAELVGVGLTPYEALRTATANPAEFLGELEQAGTVEAGKRADLLLLEENPLENIANSRKIAGVMVRGRRLPKSELDRGMQELAPYFEGLGR